MLQDRCTKVLLTVLAVGVWALALSYAGTPVVLAKAAADAIIDAGPPAPVSTEEASSGAPFVTYPLRWYVSLVHHEVTTGSITCKTGVAVVNLHSSSVNVQLAFFDGAGTVLANRSSTVAAGAMYYEQTDAMAEYPSTGTQRITGHGRVYADHPNVLAMNYVECPAGAVSVTSYPVGATADFFQASLPAAGSMAPHAEVVEGPQSH